MTKNRGLIISFIIVTLWGGVGCGAGETTLEQLKNKLPGVWFYDMTAYAPGAYSVKRIRVNESVVGVDAYSSSTFDGGTTFCKWWSTIVFDSVDETTSILEMSETTHYSECLPASTTVLLLKLNDLNTPTFFNFGPKAENPDFNDPSNVYANFNVTKCSDDPEDTNPDPSKCQFTGVLPVTWEYPSE